MRFYLKLIKANDIPQAGISQFPNRGTLYFNNKYKIPAIYLNKIKKFFCEMYRRRPSLIFCVLMDLIGYASYGIPLLGEISDFIWAPVSALIFFLTFGGWKGALGGIGNFIEEILPGTDFIPSFTIMWFIRQSQGKNNNTRPRFSKWF